MILPIAMISLGCTLLGVTTFVYSRLCRHDAWNCTGAAGADNSQQIWTLSKLVDRAEAGEDVIIARAGKPVAKLVALRADRPRRSGPWRSSLNTSYEYRVTSRP